MRSGAEYAHGIDQRATIGRMKELLEGRRVVSIEQCIYQVDDYEDDPPQSPVKTEYPVLKLDDGSEVIVLDGWGAPPIIEMKREPYVAAPLTYEGDQA